MPTCGTQYYRLDGTESHTVYAHALTDDEKSRALHAVEDEARRLGLWEAETWGDILEDRGSQITFSALGQRAPLAAKTAWDPTGAKKNTLREAVAAQHPRPRGALGRIYVGRHHPPRHRQGVRHAPARRADRHPAG